MSSLIAVTALFAAGATATRAPVSPPTGLLIITLDTTRADRVPTFSFGGVVTPALSALADRSAVFERAMIVAPLTLPAHARLFTGLYPFHHGVRDNGDSLSDTPDTLALVLRARRYRTAASVGSIVLLHDRGLGRGFDTFADAQVGRLLRALEFTLSTAVDDYYQSIRAAPRRTPFR